MQMVAIEIHGLSKRFGDVAAVDDLSFSARAGAVMSSIYLRALRDAGVGRRVQTRLLRRHALLIVGGEPLGIALPRGVDLVAVDPGREPRSRRALRPTPISAGIWW
jgi:ABC-type histidine transport system ATPase subunit